MSFRSPFGRATARRLALAAALAAAAASGFAGDCKYKRVGTLPYRWSHDRMLVDGGIGDRDVVTQIDTGGVGVIVFEDAAQRLGLSLGHVGEEMYGVGGKSEIYRARLTDFHLGRFAWPRVGARVVPRNGERAVDAVDVLVGSTVLLQNDLEITADALHFFEPAACDGTSLAYWDEETPWLPIAEKSSGDRSVDVTVSVDGVPVLAAVDTGAPFSILDISVARRLGFDPARAQPVGDARGYGTHPMRQWLGDFDRIDIGPEVVHHPTFLVGDLWGAVRSDAQRDFAGPSVENWPRMLLGADFIRTHRLLFAMGQRRLYFSYVGGQPFVRPSAPPASAAQDGTAQ